jgi:hypothetical protein
MGGEMANKQALVNYLDRKVFDPILHASSENYSAADEKALQDVKRRTKTEKDRYYHYSTAADIRQNYESDLHSEAAKKVNAELKRLNLPHLADVKDEFLALADEEK